MRNLTTLEQNIATRAALVFADRPHIGLLGADDRGFDWLYKPENLRYALDCHIGTWVIWKSAYSTADQVPENTGGIPLDEDGHLHYSDPVAMQLLINYIHDFGGRVVFYVAPGRWRQDGMSAGLAVDEILRFAKQHNLDGVWLDGGEFGNNEWETADAFERLRTHGLYVICHFSSVPNVGNNEWVYGLSEPAFSGVEYLLPFARFVDVGIWGEKNTAHLMTEEDALATLKRVSHVDTHPHMQMVYKPAEGTVYAGDPARRMPLLSRLLYIERIGPANMYVWKRDGLPTWLEEQAKWRADPDGYVRRWRRAGDG
jgi:hypothetical protein